MTKCAHPWFLIASILTALAAWAAAAAAAHPNNPWLGRGKEVVSLLFGLVWIGLSVSKEPIFAIHCHYS